MSATYRKTAHQVQFGLSKCKIIFKNEKSGSFHWLLVALGSSGVFNFHYNNYRSKNTGFWCKCKLTTVALCHSVLHVGQSNCLPETAAALKTGQEIDPIF